MNEKIDVRGVIRMCIYRIECFECKTCGAQWESEPYENTDA